MAVETMTSTVDGMIRELKKMKHQVGGNADVCVVVPHSDGIGCRTIPVVNVFWADGVVNLAMPKQY